MNAAKNELLVARLTPVGLSAVSCVGVFGDGASELAREAWRRADGGASDAWRERRPEESRRPIFGRFHYAGFDAPGEEVVAYRRGRLALELDCHGGDFVTSKILDYFIRRGARKISGDEWLRIAERAEGFRPTTAFQALFTDACDELTARAATEETAKIACDQREAARAFERELATLLRDAEQGSNDAAARVDEKLARLLTRRAWGRKLFEPFVVSFLGVANSGKSSLFNALLGRERAAVSDYEGTTRDLIDSAVVINGWRFRLVDSAGLRETDDKVEREGIELARQAARRSDLTLRIYDATRDYLEQDAAIRAVEPNDSQTTYLNVWNKIDLAIEEAARPENVEFVSTSAKTGEGTDALSDAIFARTVGRLDRARTSDGREELTLWSDGQIRLIERLANDCRRGRYAEALSAFVDNFENAEHLNSRRD